MDKNIIIQVGNLKVKTELNNSKTASAIYDRLPIEAEVKLWGEEIYFDIPVKLGIEKEFAKSIVELGDLGYWSQGSCFCIFFGMTPVSRDNQIRPASAVNVIGKVLGNPQEFKKVKERERIRIEKDGPSPKHL